MLFLFRLRSNSQPTRPPDLDNDKENDDDSNTERSRSNTLETKKDITTTNGMKFYLSSKHPIFFIDISYLFPKKKIFCEILLYYCLW